MCRRQPQLPEELGGFGRWRSRLGRAVGQTVLSEFQTVDLIICCIVGRKSLSSVVGEMVGASRRDRQTQPVPSIRQEAAVLVLFIASSLGAVLMECEESSVNQASSTTLL